MNSYKSMFNTEMLANNFQELALEEKSKDHKDCVFLWMYTQQGKPYQKYKDQKDNSKTMCLVLLRWDGSFGAPGGKVDPGESLKEALFREVQEELGVELNLAEKQKVYPLLSIKMKDWHIHSYCMEIGFDRISDLFLKSNVFLNQNQSKQQGLEVAGVCLAHLCAYSCTKEGDPRGVDLFLSNQFAATAKVELLALLSKE